MLVTTASDSFFSLVIGSNFGPVTFDDEWVSLFTSIFVHFGMLHLAVNMWCLWDFGRVAEHLLGRLRFLLVYVVSGLLAGLTGLFWDPMRISGGASGAIFGVAGALISFLYFKKASLTVSAAKRELGSLAAFTLFSLVFGLGARGIDNAGHLGGLVTGLALGALLPPMILKAAWPQIEPPAPAGGNAMLRSRARVRVFLIAAGAVLVVIAGFAIARRINLPVLQLGEAQDLLDKGQTDQFIKELEKVVASRPKLAVAQYQLGAAYLWEGRYKEALPPLRRAVDLEKHENVYAENDLALAYLTNKDYDQAIVWFEKLAPTDPEAHLGLGMAYLAKGQLNRAVTELNEGSRWFPNRHFIWLGQVYLSFGRFDDARAAFQKVLQKYPDAEAEAGLKMAEAKTQMDLSDHLLIQPKELANPPDWYWAYGLKD